MNGSAAADRLRPRSITFTITTDTSVNVFSKLSELLLTKTEAGRTPIGLLDVSATSFARENEPLQLFFDFRKNY